MHYPRRRPKNPDTADGARKDADERNRQPPARGAPRQSSHARQASAADTSDHRDPDELIGWPVSTGGLLAGLRSISRKRHSGALEAE